ncbi:PCI domain-containing protein, partial [Ochromonadaceae sp. CCMP2298]
ITRGVELNQPRLLHRAIRQNASVRRIVSGEQLEQLVRKYIPTDCPTYGVMGKALEKVSHKEVEEKKESEAMDLDEEKVVPVSTVLPEVEVYIFTLIVTTLLREGCNAEAAYAATALVERIRTFNRRTLDVFTSKAYFYLSLSYERIDRLQSIRPTLLALYRTACVRHDDMGQAVLLNLLLRNYLTFNLFEQAHTLSLRAAFPESASNNQFCRYLYYMGRIQAVQLEYSEAFQRLMMAARKAPQGYANGFTVMVHKLVVLVQLLMGDIPERSLFNTPELRGPLRPYFALTQAVRTGDLMQFGAVMEAHKEAFRADNNLTLVERLRHNVLKTGLRKISVSYSRISLQDMAAKLHLPSARAAEYICAKAVRDGVIEAKIDHENGWITSHEVVDLYGTEEPQRAFHKRIAFCLDVHNEAVKSMRYPPEELYKLELLKQSGKAGKKDSDKQDEKTIEELIKEMEEDEDED